MSPFLIPGLLAVGFLFVRYPYALAALALFLPMESSGVGALVASSCGILVPLIYAGFFLAVGKTLYALWGRRNTSPASRRLLTTALLAAGTSGWIALSMFAYDAGKSVAITTSLGAVPGVIFALAYYNHRPARVLLVVALAVHLVIGCGIIAFPQSPLAILRPATTIGGTLPDVWKMETTSYKDSAQFDSAGQLAFYGAAGLILGMSLLLYHRRTLVRGAGVLLAGLGLTTTFFTTERGIWIGIIVGMLVLIGPLRKRPVGKAVYAAVIASLVLGVFAVCTSTDNALLVIIRQHFLGVQNDAYRVPVAIRSMDILLTRPVFGVGGNVLNLVDLAGGAPHQALYFFAVAYGIPAGICVAVMTWRSLAVNFAGHRSSRTPGLPQYDRLVGRSLGWVVLAMAMTNGMSGGMLGWILLGFACLPWAHNVSSRRRGDLQLPNLRAFPGREMVEVLR